MRRLGLQRVGLAVWGEEPFLLHQALVLAEGGLPTAAVSAVDGPLEAAGHILVVGSAAETVAYTVSTPSNTCLRFLAGKTQAGHEFCF